MYQKILQILDDIYAAGFHTQYPEGYTPEFIVLMIRKMGDRVKKKAGAYLPHTPVQIDRQGKALINDIATVVWLQGLRDGKSGDMETTGPETQPLFYILNETFKTGLKDDPRNGPSIGTILQVLINTVADAGPVGRGDSIVTRLATTLEELFFTSGFDTQRAKKTAGLFHTRLSTFMSAMEQG